MRLAVLVGAIALLSAGNINVNQAPQPAPRQPAYPVDPITTIVDAFRAHPIVALGEGAHGNEQGYAFRVSLLHDRRFTAVVDDIVVESGSSRYQDAMDQYIRGDDVPDSVLRELRENAVVATPVWDRPIYAQFFTEVAKGN